MSLATIISCIKGDKVEDAYIKTQELLGRTDNKESAACSILRALNELIYPILQKNSSCKSDVRIIFKLSDLCSKWVSVTWNCRHSVFMQSLYHIKRYLLNKGFLTEAKQLCGYFFLLHSFKNNSKWETPEKLVISNSIFNFTNFVIEADEIFFKEHLEKNGNLFFSLWKFHADLIELNALDQLGLHFTLSAKFLTMLPIIPVSKNVVVNRIFLNYGDWFKDLSFRISLIKLSEKDVSLFCSLLSAFLHCRNEEELRNYEFEPILYGIKSLLVVNEVKDISDSLLILLKVIMLCSSFQGEGSVDIFLDFKNALSNKLKSRNQSFLYNVISFSFHLIFKMRSSFVKTNSFLERTLPEFVNILLNVYSYIKANSSPMRAKLIEQVNILFTALYFTFAPHNSCENLVGVFKDMRSVFKAFFSISSIEEKNGLLCFGVSGCINVLLTYNKAELYCQAATLGISLIKYLLKVETINLTSPSMKTNISYAINAFALSLGKIGHHDTAQVGLLAFVGTHKEFYEAVFTAWVNLKLDGANSCFQETTVYDVIQNSREAFENDWSFNIDLLCVDDLLLKEIKAYMKHRSLQGEPVLAVYKTGAKVCTNKLILAEILVCATDVVTTQPNLTSISSFQMSIGNMIQFLSNRQDGADDKDKAHILCLLGNLHYIQARCEIMHLRKKSEAEVVQLELRPKNIIPVLEANEGDILNESTMVPSFMYLKLESQEKILNLLEKAAQFWKKAIHVLRPGMDDDYFCMSLTYIKATAYLYRLYIYKVKEADIWELLYNVSNKLNISKYKVLAVAELLGIQLKVRDDWIKSAKLWIENKDFEKKTYIEHLFIVNLSKNAFYNNEVEESLKIITSLNVGEVRANFLVYVQLQLLKSVISSVLMKPDASEIKLSPIAYKAVIILAVKVFENLLYIISHSKWSTFTNLTVVHCLLLDMASFLGKMYSDMQNVRYARCYTKQQLLLAQRLALPIRVTELLILLAQLDVHCSNMMDCGVKLRGIETILEFENFENELTYEEEDTSMLCASPALKATVKLKPKFSSHKSSCLCFQCRNIDYQIQSLQAITLRANFFLAKGSHSQVKQLFKVGKTLINAIYVKYQQLHANFLTALVEAEIRFYITIVEALGQWSSVNKALEYCSIAKDRLNTKPVSDPMLKNILFCQENFLRWMESYVSPKTKRDLTPVSNRTPLNDAVTPTNCEPHTINRLRVKFPSVPPISVSPMPLKFRRRLVLDDSEDEAGPTKGSTKSKVSSKNADISVFMIEEKDKIKMNKKSKENLKDTSPKLKKRILTKKTVQTERKARKKKINLEMSPDMSNRPMKSPFKIYCDTFDTEITGIASTTKRKGRPRKDISIDPHSSTFGTTIKVERKLFYGSSNDDQEDNGIDLEEGDQIKIKEQSRIEENTVTKVDKLSQYRAADPDLSIIEGTPPDNTNPKVSLTSVALLKDFEKLSLSSKYKPKGSYSRSTRSRTMRDENKKSS